MAAPNWQNRTLFHGDNLPFLRAMNSESVDLIATDPPFNKGRDFHATPDSLAAGARFQDRWSWERDVHREWVEQIKDDYPAIWEVINAANAIYGQKTKKNRVKLRDEMGSDMGAFLCFMAVRLLEMHRVLKSTGSIYLQCDPTASHYLKAILDAIFGQKQFVNEIVWNRSQNRSSISRKFRGAHDILLFYGKNDTERQFNMQYRALSEASQATYNKKDNKGWYQDVPLLVSGKRRGETGTIWHGIDPNTRGKDGMHWVTTPDKLDQYEADGLVLWPSKPGGIPRLKYYLTDSPGAPINDLWYDIPLISSQSPESCNFPTQKPLLLYERIILASSNKDDIIFDPFAGCATTLIAAEKLDRQWVGIDIWDNAYAIVLERMQRERLVLDSTQPDAVQPDLYPTAIQFTAELPTRTDNGDPVVPFLRVKERVKEPNGKQMSRTEMYDFLLTQHGPRCQGCDRVFDDPRYLELDHNTPRSDGGLNHISNRILLCGPCNRAKSNQYTLSGLRRLNKKNGWMVKP